LIKSTYDNTYQQIYNSLKKTKLNSEEKYEILGFCLLNNYIYYTLFLLNLTEINKASFLFKLRTNLQIIYDYIIKNEDMNSYIQKKKIKLFNTYLSIDNFEHVGIILENLIDKKYKINLNLNIESIDVTLKIINSMAKLHSNFWNKDLHKMFPALKKTNDDIFCPFFTDFINERYDLFKNKWFKILNKVQINKCDEIYNNYSHIQQHFSTGNNLTFIHGDIKSPNIFYDIENDFEPYFIDWQHCAIGKGAQDLMFFIIESFDITNIKMMFQLTKHYYYKKLLEYGVTDYSVNEYEHDLYNAICYIPFFTSIWFGTIPQDELIDKNFPYFLISKMFYLIENITSF
jgi:hypothetical protein